MTILDLPHNYTSFVVVYSKTDDGICEILHLEGFEQMATLAGVQNVIEHVHNVKNLLPNDKQVYIMQIDRKTASSIISSSNWR
jgi:hypothetical protein